MNIHHTGSLNVKWTTQLHLLRCTLPPQSTPKCGSFLLRASILCFASWCLKQLHWKLSPDQCLKAFVEGFSSLLDFSPWIVASILHSFYTVAGGFGWFFCGENYILVALMIDADKPHIHRNLELLPEVLILFLSLAVHLVCVSVRLGDRRAPG